jgi:transposase InsO family protein
VFTSTSPSITHSVSQRGSFDTNLVSIHCGVRVSAMPTATGTVGGQQVTVLRDTGCSGVIVRRSLVQEGELLGKQQRCILVDGSVLETPVANIVVNTPYFTGNVEAQCMHSPLYDLIIGNIEGARPPNDPEIVENIVQGVQTRGQKRKDAETYTELIVPPAIGEIDPGEFRAAQGTDETLRVVHEKSEQELVQTLASGAKISFCRKRGLLYRHYQSPKVQNGRLFTQLVVPKQYRLIVMKLAHESILAGHQGVTRTSRRVLEEFYWPGIQADTTRYCRSCDVCQRTVSKGRVTKAPLGIMPVIDVPFQRVAVDIIGPIQPHTDRGNRYILTIVDYATRYPDAIALPSIETERVAEALVEVYTRVGVPREMLTDMGSQFTSSLMAEVSRLLSIRQLTTTPYHPMCNGLVERFNGTLKQMLRRLCADRPKDWDRYLGALLFAYREVPQESLGFSPFELLFGRAIRGPMAILRELFTKEVDDPDIKTTYQFVLDLRERLEDTSQKAQEMLKISSARYRQVYNRRAREKNMKVGEQVLVLLPT